MNEAKQKLILAEKKTKELFNAVEEGGLMAPGKSEQELTVEIVNLARDLFGIDQYWHKKIVRTGPIRFTLTMEIRPTGLFKKMISCF